MLKVVVFDGGYGGEFFADRLEAELPVLEVIRVVDWRHADDLLKSKRRARRAARNALRPYIGKVDLIIFANHLLTLTSLKYFRRKYKNQKFIGFDLKTPDTFISRDVAILTTSAVARTFKYYKFLFNLPRRATTLRLDDWPARIDDGELNEPEISSKLRTLLIRRRFWPEEIVLACSQFEDIKPELKNIFGHNVKIYDSFDDCIRNVCKTLRIRGGTGRKT